MKPAAFLNLPMQTCGRRVINLHAIDAEVVLLRGRMFGVNERQRDEWSTVFLPGGNHRQLLQICGTIDYRRHWRARCVARTETKKLAPKFSVLPELTRLRRN